MFTRPDELTDETLRSALMTGWAFHAVTIEYQAVGFGSHHWLATDAGGDRRFVTADDLGAKHCFIEHGVEAAFDLVAAALGTARRLADSGLVFVVAPMPSIDGTVLRFVDERFAGAVYPFVEGQPLGDEAFESAADRLAVLEVVAQVHAASGPAAEVAGREDFVLPNRTHLVRALAELDQRWAAGPYGERARELVAGRADHLRSELERYDSLDTQVAASARPLVVTHGEPHEGNVLRTAAGDLAVIDWDTTLLAPPERDLWVIDAGDGVVCEAYAEMTGYQADRVALELYRLGYDLFEVGGYLSFFRAPHGATADAAESWQNLRFFVTPLRERPPLPAS